MDIYSSETKSVLNEISGRLEALAVAMRTFDIMYSRETRDTMTHAATAYDHAADIVKEYLR